MPRLGVGVGLYPTIHMGGVPLLQLPVSGAILHLRADAGVQVTGLGVSRWKDQSGNGNDAVQATDADRPAFEAAGGPNTTPCVTFDAANTEFLDLGTLTNASNDYTVFAVVTQTTVAGTQTLLSSSATTVLAAVRGGRVATNDATAWRNAMTAAATEQLLTWRLNSAGTSVEVYRDSTVLSSGTYDATWAWGSPEIGKLTGGTDYFNGKLSELIIFPTALSDADVTTIHAYLATRYAITFDLAVSIAGNILWLDAALGITLNGANVSAWADQGPGGNDATQATAARQPLFEATAGPNSLPSVTFDSANTEFMSLIGMSDTSNSYTVFAVMNPDTLVDLQTVVGFNVSDDIMAVRTLNVGIYDGVTFRIPVAATTVAQMLTWWIDAPSTSMEVFRDGSLLGVDTYDGTMTWLGPQIGARGGLINAWNYDGKMSQLIIYNHSLTDEELALVHAELLTKFAIEFTPLSVAGCVEWYRADLGITLNGSNVSAWANQGTTGAARDIAQGTANRQPAFLATGNPAGGPCIEFDGVIDFLRGTWVQAQPTHLFAVAVVAQSAVAGATVIDGNVGNTRRIYVPTNVRIDGYAGANLQVTTDPTQWHRIETLYNGAASRHRIDDLVPATGNIGANASNGLIIGMWGDQLSVPADALVAEIFEYDRNTLTAEEQTALHAYMTTRYGI